MNPPVWLTDTVPLAVVAVATVNRSVSLSGSVAFTLPVTTPELALTLIVGAVARGAELLGAIVAVTVTAREPPYPSDTVIVKVSVTALVEERAEVRAAAVGV